LSKSRGITLQPTDWIQLVVALSTLALAVLTWNLARSTKTMADETRRLADQAARQLAYGEQGRQDAVRPVVVFSLTARHPDAPLKNVIRSSDFRIQVMNVGVGPALEVEATVIHGAREFEIRLQPEAPRPLILPANRGSLDGDFSWELEEDGRSVFDLIQAEQAEGRGGTIRVRYRDVLGGGHLATASLVLDQEMFDAEDRLSMLGPIAFERTS
jgi:hypothetical protein